MVILDTSVIIDHLRRVGRGNSVLLTAIERYPNDEFCISTISVQELYEGKSILDSEKESLLLATLGQFNILPYNFMIAQKAGEIARDVESSVGFADAAIAATAINHNARVFTLDRKDFVGFKEVKLLDFKG